MRLEARRAEVDALRARELEEAARRGEREARRVAEERALQERLAWEK